MQREVIFSIVLIGLILVLPPLLWSSLAIAQGSDVRVSIGDMEIPPGGVLTEAIMVKNATDFGAGTICISYDSSVVQVVNVSSGDGLIIGAWNANNSVNPGYVRISSYSTSGRSGDVVFARVKYKAVGAGGSRSTLNISVDSLFDIGYKDISYSIENGSLLVSEAVGGEFDTGAGGGYPSIAGVHEGFIIPNHTIIVKKMYTYPCAGTGGHAEYVEICNVTSSSCINATWEGYQAGDYHNITFPARFTLARGELYKYTIITGSYPRIIHRQNYTTSDGSFINCTSFVDVNGNLHEDWLPAIKLFDEEVGE